jgi:Ca2+-binding EF-hand superfamily protein
MSIRFTEKQLNELQDVLREAPYKAAAPLLNHLSSEITRLYNEQYDKQREPKTVDHHPV